MTHILLFVRDFELGTKLSGLCTDLDHPVKFADEKSDPKEFGDSVKMAIVDLDDKIFSSVGLISELARYNLKVVGYMNQVNNKDQSRLKNAGCEMILPRSSLVKNMPTLIDELIR